MYPFHSFIWALVALLGTVDAFWRLPCEYPLTQARIDPIISPGTVSAHTHTVMGGDGLSYTTTYDQMRNSKCSTCRVTQDMSAYWEPALFYVNQNGSFTLVEQVGGATIYYLQRREPGEKLVAFPKGFRMVAGNPFLRRYNDTLEQRAISFACLDYKGPLTPQMSAFPNRNCPDGLRTQVIFPSCWNGKDLDPPDHKSHMAYPSLVDNGKCPPSHPVRFITLFYEIIWNTNAFKHMWYGGNQPFALAMGDTTGYGLHADFLNGWDIPTLQKAIDTCTSNSGNVKDCHVFNLRPSQQWGSHTCKAHGVKTDDLSKPVKHLPGCNPLQRGPGMAKMFTNCWWSKRKRSLHA